MQRIASSSIACTCRQSLQVRTAATTAKNKPKARTTLSKSKAKSKGGKGSEGGDSKTEILKQMLYGSEARAQAVDDSQRLAELEKVIPSVEAHETIERAWKLHQRRLREEREQSMKDRYTAMRVALQELEKADSKLYTAAVEGPKFSTYRRMDGPQGAQMSREGRIEGLFPRQLAVPTNKAGSKIFDEAWKRPT